MRRRSAQPGDSQPTPRFGLAAFAALASGALFYAVPLWLERQLDPAVTLAGLMVVDAVLVLVLARSRHSAGMLAALLVLLVATALLRTGVLVALPFVLLCSALAAGFAVTLRKGSTPLITRIVLHRHAGALTESGRHYFRGLTAGWAVLFAALAVGSALLALYAPFRTWSLFTNLLSWPMIGAMFVGEYLLRRLAFRDLPADNPLEVIAATLSYPWWPGADHE